MSALLKHFCKILPRNEFKVLEIVMSTSEDRPFYLWGDHKVTLEFDDDLDDFYREKAREELRENPETVKEGLKSLKELLSGELDLEVPHDNDEFLIRFLRPCKWYPKSAAERIKLYYEMRANSPKYFDNVTPTNEEKVLRGGKLRHLPYRTSEGARIFLIESGAKWDPNDISADEAFRGIDLITNALSFEPKTQVAGIHVIFDYLDMPFRHVMHFTPSYAYAFSKFFQDGLPVRFKSVHIIRQPMIFNFVWAIFKPFVTKKFVTRIHFHGTDFASLHKHIHPSVLPKEFGGELDLPLNDPIDDEILDLFQSYEQKFIDAAKHGYIWRKKL